jgi:hypothetical protein
MQMGTNFEFFTWCDSVEISAAPSKPGGQWNESYGKDFYFLSGFLRNFRREVG